MGKGVGASTGASEGLATGIAGSLGLVGLFGALGLLGLFGALVFGDLIVSILALRERPSFAVTNLLLSPLPRRETIPTVTKDNFMMEASEYFMALRQKCDVAAGSRDFWNEQWWMSDGSADLRENLFMKEKCVIVQEKAKSVEPTASSYTSTFWPFWKRVSNPICLNQRHHLNVNLSSFPKLTNIPLDASRPYK